MRIPNFSAIFLRHLVGSWIHSLGFLESNNLTKVIIQKILLWAYIPPPLKSAIQLLAPKVHSERGDIFLSQRHFLALLHNLEYFGHFVRAPASMMQLLLGSKK